MYELQKKTDTKRTYRSTITGTEISTYFLCKSESGVGYWAFEDLLSIPFIRKKAAESITNLYGINLSETDIDAFILKLKETIKSSDSEKYEKAYSQLLNFEALKNQTVDSNKQSLSLCAVYILADDETIDTFSQTKTMEKIANWTLEPKLQSFFLTWLNEATAAYTAISNNIIATASIANQ
jgi:hypothetical protein